MIKECPTGRRSVFSRVLIAAVFSIAFVCLATANGSAQTPQTQTNNTCGQLTAPTLDTTPTTMGYLDFNSGIRLFNGGFAYSNDVSSLYTIVGGLQETLVTKILTSIVPTVAVIKPDQNQANIGSPCVGPVPANQ